MEPISDVIELDRLGLKPGGGWRGEIFVRAQKFVFGDQTYEPADSPLPVMVDVSHTTTGFVLRVRFTATVEGPCMRCFDDQGFEVTVDQSEVHEPAIDDELASDYVSPAGIFDLAGYVHGAIGLALPQTMSGPLDEQGGCELCGRTVEELHAIGIASDTAEEGGDPRWAKLRELEL